MRRALVALLLAIVATAPSVNDATAYETWCADDPIVVVDGHLLHIQVQMPLAELLAMRSTRLTVVIPQNVGGFVLLDDISVFPMQTSVAARGPIWAGTGPLPVTVVVEVDATKSYPIRVVAKPVTPLTRLLAPPVTAIGTTNRRLELPLTLGG
ncbi:MAG: hypothetical protein AB7R89_14240 [Dehalococcoidia bacterium]